MKHTTSEYRLSVLSSTSALSRCWDMFTAFVCSVHSDSYVTLDATFLALKANFRTINKSCLHTISAKFHIGTLYFAEFDVRLQPAPLLYINSSQY